MSSRKLYSSAVWPKTNATVSVELPCYATHCDYQSNIFDNLSVTKLYVRLLFIFTLKRNFTITICIIYFICNSVNTVHFNQDTLHINTSNTLNYFRTTNAQMFNSITTERTRCIDIIRNVRNTKLSWAGHGTSTAPKTTDIPHGDHTTRKTNRETSQAAKRWPGQILEGHDLAQDIARQVNFEAAC